MLRCPTISYHFLGWSRRPSLYGIVNKVYNTIGLLSYVTDRDTGTRIKTENDSNDDWVWDFDLDKVINAYQILVKKHRFGDIYFIVTKDKPR